MPPAATTSRPLLPLRLLLPLFLVMLVAVMMVEGCCPYGEESNKNKFY
jgi:hypothetical protein